MQCFFTELCALKFSMLTSKTQLYFVSAFPKISTQAFTTFLLAPLSVIFLGTGDNCQQEGFFAFRLILVLLKSS